MLKWILNAPLYSLCQDFYYESPLGETGEFIYTMNAEQNETGLFSFSANILKDTESWSANVKVFNGSRQKLFSG